LKSDKSRGDEGNGVKERRGARSDSRLVEKREREREVETSTKMNEDSRQTRTKVREPRILSYSPSYYSVTQERETH
jgi:hypothetical protein